MAGTIEITGGTEWSAATWLYEWALKIASEQIGNPVLKQKLQDVIDSNVGWVNLGDFSPSERAEIAEALHTALVPESDRRLPATVPNRRQVLDLLRELARLAYTATPRYYSSGAMQGTGCGAGQMLGRVSRGHPAARRLCRLPHCASCRRRS